MVEHLVSIPEVLYSNPRGRGIMVCFGQCKGGQDSYYPRDGTTIDNSQTPFSFLLPTAHSSCIGNRGIGDRLSCGPGLPELNMNLSLAFNS